jgi:ankyrin repeat protein
MAEFLIKHGADADVEDRYCSSPLSEAVENNNKELVKLILAQGIIYPMCDGGEYSYDRIIDQEHIKIDENIRELLIEAEEVAEKKRHINFLKREKELLEFVAAKKRREKLEKFIKEISVENKDNERTLKKFIKKLGREFVESALAYEEEFVKTGFTTEYKYDSDKKTYTYKTTYH